MPHLALIDGGDKLDLLRKLYLLKIPLCHIASSVDAEMGFNGLRQQQAADFFADLAGDLSLVQQSRPQMHIWGLDSPLQSGVESRILNSQYESARHFDVMFPPAEELGTISDMSQDDQGLRTNDMDFAEEVEVLDFEPETPRRKKKKTKNFLLSDKEPSDGSQKLSKRNIKILKADLKREIIDDIKKSIAKDIMAEMMEKTELSIVHHVREAKQELRLSHAEILAESLNELKASHEELRPKKEEVEEIEKLMANAAETRLALEQAQSNAETINQTVRENWYHRRQDHQKLLDESKAHLDELGQANEMVKAFSKELRVQLASLQDATTSGMDQLRNAGHSTMQDGKLEIAEKKAAAIESIVNVARIYQKEGSNGGLEISRESSDKEEIKTIIKDTMQTFKKEFYEVCSEIKREIAEIRAPSPTLTASLIEGADYYVDDDDDPYSSPEFDF